MHLRPDPTAALAGAIQDEAAAGGATPPPSTYRLQLGPGLGFAAAAQVVPYLARLGVGAVYLSPVLAAAPGSTHGYDVVDHGRVSPALGGEAAFDELCRVARAAGLGVLVDVVPNHMGVGAENACWMELLENGPSAVTAPWFDVDWEPVKAALRHKVLVPVLGDQYGRVLERGELRLAREGGAFLLRYFDHRFPIAPRTVPLVLRHGLAATAARLGGGHPHLQELESICSALEKLAPREAVAPGAVAERAREKEVAKRRLAALCEASLEVSHHVDGALDDLNGRVGEPRSFDRLHALLEAQAYRLASWRVSGEEINYRRFFDVDALAALRMEEPAVFRAAHAVLLERVARGLVTGLRVDHPDGLYDPTGYFRRLQAAALVARARARLARPAVASEAEAAEVEAAVEATAAAMRDGALPARPLFVVAEKILARGERMPEGWAVHGTTGYDFLGEVNGLFLDPAGAAPLEALRRRLAARRTDFRAEALEARRLVSTSLMASELEVLAHRLDRLSEADRRTRDFTLAELRQALVEYVAQFGVYRTYVSPEGELDPRDAAAVEAALGRARRAAGRLDPSIFDFLGDLLLLRPPAALDEAARRERLEFVLKLQQVTGPVSAKALEDTAFYSHVRLLALNEVGGDPAAFGATPDAFHARCAERLDRWPGSLLATSTHDTKRAEDVRARLDALSEVPDEWAALVRSWSRLNRRLATRRRGGAAPDRTDEHLLYQTLVGTWPDEAGPAAPGWPAYLDRLEAYLVKALREAKRHTSWRRVDAEYEEAAARFLRGCLASPSFVAEVDAFARRVAAAGRVTSLAQVALRGAAPGVADVYQGTELWDLSLVDPDNRRPVDFAARDALLAALDAGAAGGAAARRAQARELGGPEALPDGRAKLLLQAAALRARRDDPELFLSGAYHPLAVEGEDAGHAVALVRTRGERAVACLVPRLLLARGRGGEPPGWRGRVVLPGEAARRWVDLVTGVERPGGPLELADAFADFPVALLAARP